MDLQERNDLIEKMSHDIEKINQYLNGLSVYFQRQENGNIITDIKVQAIIEALISQGIVDKDVLDGIYKRIIRETQEQIEAMRKEQELEAKEEEEK